MGVATSRTFTEKGNGRNCLRRGSYVKLYFMCHDVVVSTFTKLFMRQQYSHGWEGLFEATKHLGLLMNAACLTIK